MLEKIKNMTNEELLELYTLVVKINHYDPYETPKIIKELDAANITKDMLETMVLERMNSKE